MHLCKKKCGYQQKIFHQAHIKYHFSLKLYPIVFRLELVKEEGIIWLIPRINYSLLTTFLEVTNQMVKNKNTHTHHCMIPFCSEKVIILKASYSSLSLMKSVRIMCIFIFKYEHMFKSIHTIQLMIGLYF